MVKHLLRICLRWFGTVTAGLALGLSFPSTAVFAQDQPSIPNSLTAQEEDIREAAFLFLFEIGAGPDPDYSFYCLSVDSAGLAKGDDPSEALLKRLSRTHRTIRKASNCEIIKKPKDLFSAVRDKQSGRPAWMISLTSISWINDKEVRGGGYAILRWTMLVVLYAASDASRRQVESENCAQRVCSCLSSGNWVQARVGTWISREVICAIRRFPTSAVTRFGRSRPAADASREAVQRWLLDGLYVSVGHRRCSCDPSQKTDAGRTPAS